MVFLWGVVITSTLEYLTSFVMEKMFHTRWWDYSRYRFNLNGRICLLNAVWLDVPVCGVRHSPADL